MTGRHVWITAWLAGALAGLAACTAAGSGAVPGVSRPRPPGMWLDDVPATTSLRLTPAEARALAERARARLSHAAHEVPLPARLRADSEPRALFISVSDGRGPADVALGVGPGVAQALDRALARLDALPRPVQPAWIALDLVTQVEPRREVGRDEPPDPVFGFAFGEEGVAFDAEVGVAFPAREVVGRRLVGRTGRMRLSRLADRAGRRGSERARSALEHARRLGVRRFRTQGFFFDAAEGRAYALERGHVRARAVSDERLQRAIAAGADYLTRSVDARGRFAYSYLAKQGRLADEYNMVRHAGTIYAMLEVYAATREPALLAAAERAIDYMGRHIEPYGAAGSGEPMSALAFGGKIKLGGVALAALTLATHVEVTGSRAQLEPARRLGRYLRAQQRPDGSFLHQRAHPSGEPLPFISEYYPGEALLALMAVYRLDRDPAWLESARAGARYLIEVRDRGVPTERLTHDHWLLYALERIHREHPEPLFFEHAMRIAQAIMSAQERAAGADVDADEVGGYGRPPRSTPIATRNEGLLAAHAMARRAGRHDLAAAILEAVELGNEVLVSMQIDPPRALYLADPARALGGVTRAHDHYEVRIDYVQHSLSAWLALARARATGEARSCPAC